MNTRLRGGTAAAFGLFAMSALADPLPPANPQVALDMCVLRHGAEISKVKYLEDKAKVVIDDSVCGLEVAVLLNTCRSTGLSDDCVMYAAKGVDHALRQ
jgi:hypothetical protein